MSPTSPTRAPTPAPSAGFFDCSQSCSLLANAVDLSVGQSVGTISMPMAFMVYFEVGQFVLPTTSSGRGNFMRIYHVPTASILLSVSVDMNRGLWVAYNKVLVMLGDGSRVIENYASAYTTVRVIVQGNQVRVSTSNDWIMENVYSIASMANTTGLQYELYASAPNYDSAFGKIRSFSVQGKIGCFAYFLVLFLTILELCVLQLSIHDCPPSLLLRHPPPLRPPRARWYRTVPASARCT